MTIFCLRSINRFVDVLTGITLPLCGTKNDPIAAAEEVLPGFGMTIHASMLPVIPEAREYAAMGLVPAGAYKNREFRENMVTFGPQVDRVLQDISFDPQTSGGLLISIPGAQADALLAGLNENGIPHAAIIGEVTDTPEHIAMI